MSEFDSNQDYDMPEDTEDGGKTYPIDKDALWQSGLNAIDMNMDAVKDDYLDKGYVEGEELDALLAAERGNMLQEFSNEFNGIEEADTEDDSIDFDYSDEAIAENDIVDSDQDDLELDEDNDVSSEMDLFDEQPLDDSSIQDEDIEILDFEVTENDEQSTDDNEVSAEAQEMFQDGDLIFAPQTDEDTEVDTLAEETEELIDDIEMEEIRESDELLLDESNSYDASDEGSESWIDIIETESPPEGQDDFDKDEDGHFDSDEIGYGSEVEENNNEHTEENIQNNDNSSEEIMANDNAEWEASTEDVSELPPEMDEELIYEGLDEYDLDGISITDDTEHLHPIIQEFSEDVWSEKSVEDQKESVEKLAEYLQDVLGLENPPDIDYYNTLDDTDFGGYSARDNKLLINEYNLHMNDETVDTIAHELWHAYQHQCARSPRKGVEGSVDWQRQYGLDPKHYVSPIHDQSGKCINFDEYQSQFVEAEARAFAAHVKDYLNRMKG